MGLAKAYTAPEGGGAKGGMDLVGPADQLATWRADCALPTLDAAAAERLRVMAGIPHLQRRNLKCS